MNKIKVVIHKWEWGVLTTVEHLFEEAEEALEFGRKHIEEFKDHRIKVYDKDSQCIHSTVGDDDDDTYA